MRRTLAICLTAGIATPLHAAYQLTECVQRDQSMYLRFSAPGKVRTIRLGPNGVLLGGDVKGQFGVGAVKELRLGAARELSFVPVSGRAVEFGAVTPECAAKLREVAAPLIQLKEG